jgi:phosphoribosyl 1,2-cyclic phosphodiesterase
LDGILLSHKHLDHSGDVNGIIEGMTGGDFNRDEIPLAPKDAFEKDPVFLFDLPNLTLWEETR